MSRLESRSDRCEGPRRDVACVTASTTPFPSMSGAGACDTRREAIKVAENRPRERPPLSRGNPQMLLPLHHRLAVVFVVIAAGCVVLGECGCEMVPFLAYTAHNSTRPVGSIRDMETAGWG